MAEDAELHRILERMAARIASDALVEERREDASRRCCRLPLEGVVEASSPDEVRRVLESCRVVAIMFYSPTCPYCAAFTPIFDYVAERLRGLAGFMRVNVYDMPELAATMGVRGTPTTIIFVEGRPLTGFAGVVDEEQFEMLVREAVDKAGCSGGSMELN